MQKQTQHLSCSSDLKKETEDITEQKTKAWVIKKNSNYEIIPSPFPPPILWYRSTIPHLSIPTIIYNNNTMDLEFLVKMRQYNKCESVSNDEISSWHLGSGAGPWILCHLQDTSHIYWFHPPNQLTCKKQRTQKWDSTPNKSYCTALAYVHRTQG